jgi:uncharacterized protein
MLNVIFHVDELEKWDLTLRNVQNLLASGETNTIEVLANSEAVRIFEPTGPTATLQTISMLAQSGVIFAACHHALSAYQIAENHLPAIITVVPVGVLELVRKQAEGFAYIRP